MSYGKNDKMSRLLYNFFFMCLSGSKLLFTVHDKVHYNLYECLFLSYPQTSHGLLEGSVRTVFRVNRTKVPTIAKHGHGGLQTSILFPDHAVHPYLIILWIL